MLITVMILPELEKVIDSLDQVLGVKDTEDKKFAKRTTNLNC